MSELTNEECVARYGALEYPSGEAYLVVDLIELRDGLVHRETVYWATPFAAPAWRAPWVDREA